MNFVDSWNAILTFAHKQFIHIWRDRGFFLVILVLPPFFTIVFGHAFAYPTIRYVPTMFLDADRDNEREKFYNLLHGRDIFTALVEGSDDPEFLGIMYSKSLFRQSARFPAGYDA
jgi:hypothetical protein